MSKEGFVGGIGDYTQYLLSDPDETFATLRFFTLNVISAKFIMVVPTSKRL